MAEPNHTYYSYVRMEIERLLPAAAPGRILEIGCASGATLAWLKRRWPATETVGVDGYAPIEAELAKNADRALIHDLEESLPDIGRFDLILALDVLEHLRDPLAVLKGLVQRLSPRGAVIISVPNIAYFEVLFGLAKRQFRYREAGILDKTHLRFFTEESVIELLEQAGLTVTGGLINNTASRKRRLINFLTFGALKHYLATQYIIRGELPGGRGRQLRWKLDNGRR